METTLPVLLGAGAGFLLAVLWFDLMFDAQARRLDGPDGEARLASIADYYRRVTIEAFPANQLVGAVMLVTIVGSVMRLWRVPSVTAFVSLLLVAGPVGIAARRVLPNAMRLGGRADALEIQRALARRILWDHVVCFVCVLVFLLLVI